MLCVWVSASRVSSVMLGVLRYMMGSVNNLMLK